MAVGGLGMGDDPLDLRQRVLEGNLDPVDHVMRSLDRLVGAEDTMVVNVESLRVPAHTHIVNIVDPAILAGESAQQRFDLDALAVRDVLALENRLRHRFDMAFDLDILAEIMPYGRLEACRLVMRIAQAHCAFHLQIEADRDAAAHLLNREVMDGETMMSGDQHNLLIDGLVIERDGVGRHRHIGIGKGRPDRGGHVVLELHQILDRHGAPNHDHDGDEQDRTGGADAQERAHR